MITLHFMKLCISASLFLYWHIQSTSYKMSFLNPQKWTNPQFKTLGLNQFYSIKISIHVPDSCFVDSNVFPFSASFYNVKLNELDKIVCLYMYCHWKFFQVSLLLVYLCIQGIPEQLGTGKIACLIAVFPQLFCFPKWKCQSESKIWLCFVSGFTFCSLNCSNWEF